MDNPLITALCPTFRRPRCLEQSLWLWNKQTYPADRRYLVILDDGGTYTAQQGPNWELVTSPERLPCFTAKYNTLASMAPPATDAFLIWEDDDIYLPRYVEVHANVLRNMEYSRAEWVMSDYPGYLIEEPVGGRFFSSIGFRQSLLERVGGFGDTKRADFDQQFLAKVEEIRPSRASPWEAGKQNIQFIYGWQTGHHHAQSTMGRDNWYEDALALFPPVTYDGDLQARPMDKTMDMFEQLGLSI